MFLPHKLQMFMNWFILFYCHIAIQHNLDCYDKIYIYLFFFLKKREISFIIISDNIVCRITQ